MIERSKCILTGADDLETLFVFREFPIFMGTTQQNPAEDRKEDMVFQISRSSGMIQLQKLVPEEILYADSHNESIGEIWKQHFEQFANFIYRKKPKTILEAGGGNGRLARTYEYMCDQKVQWTIVEPSPVEHLEGVNAEYIRAFFDAQLVLPGRLEPDVLVHSHVLEHLYDPCSFLQKCANLLQEGQLMFFSVPNLKETLKRKYTNALNFEHSYFLSEDYIEWLLGKYDFAILEKEYFCKDHSIFYEVIKAGKKEKSIEFPVNLYTVNKQIFMEYIFYHKGLVNDLNEKIKNAEGNVYLFGAHIFSQYLIEFGLNVSGIQKVLDNDKNKQRKRLYGTDLMVESPQILKKEENPYVILKVGNYAEEIKRDILSNINRNTTFWE